MILDELGTGLAARGSDLNAVIHRANPALGNTDKVLKILASRTARLAKLATDSDAVLGPLAQQRRSARRLHRPGQHDVRRQRQRARRHLAVDPACCPGSCASCGR